jgi:hypothetical protein
MQFLPIAYADRIAAIEGVRSVRYMDLAVFDCASGSVTVNALGGSGLEGYLEGEGFTHAQIEAWKSDRLGLLLDKGVEGRCGWRANTGVAPTAMMGNGSVDFHVIAVSSNPGGAGVALGHYDYLNRQSAGVAGIGQAAELYVRGIDPVANEKLAASIESGFAHDSPAVEAVTDTVNRNAWLRIGKIQYLLAFVMVAVYSCCALVLVSIFMHDAGESRAKFGLLQAIGFTRPQLWGALLAQACSVMLSGIVGGVVAGYLALKLLRPLLGAFFEHIVPPSWAWTWLLFGIGALLVSIMLPISMILARMRPVDCREL